MAVAAGPQRSPLLAAAVCTGLTALIVAADIVLHPENTEFVGLLVAVPFLAAAFLSARQVVAIGAVAWLGGLAVGFVDESSASQRVRLACLAAAVAGGAVAARLRIRQADRLAALQSVADAASRAILRPLPPVLAGTRIAVRFLSASEEARVGGDLYEAVRTDHGLRMVVGDVCGKGLDAVRLASLTLGSFREAAHRETDLQQVAAAMHAAVQRDAGAEDFVTAVLVQLDEHGLTWVSCGHPSPLRVCDGAAVEVALPGALPLGIGPPPEAVRTPALPGERYLLYTDGAAEARQEGVFFPLPEAAAGALAEPDLQVAVDRLSAQVRAHGDAAAQDDVALLAFEVPQDTTAQRLRAAAPAGAAARR